MAHTGPVATPQAAAARYQGSVQTSGQRWAAGIGLVTDSPMDKAAAKSQEAISAYSARLNDPGPGGWAARLRNTPIQVWKAACGPNAVAKYNMAKGAAKWNRWYTEIGQNMAAQMRNVAMADRAAGVPWRQRVITALEVAVANSRK